MELSRRVDELEAELKIIKNEVQTVLLDIRERVLSLVNIAHPKFRNELLEAAKQKPPARYEEAVRRYYEELIR